MDATQGTLRRIDTDVLVLGGGVAGSLAASEARDAGREVLILDKAKLLERAGSVGGGVDQFLTPMNSGAEWDTPENLLLYIPTLTDGLVDMAVAERVVHEMPRVLGRLEGMGIDFRDPDTGEFLRTRAFGLPGEFHLNFDGTRFKYRIAKSVKKAGSQFIGRAMATDVLVDPDTGEAFGALGFNIRTGEWYVIRARSVIVATGEVNRIARNASGLPFDSWHYPYNTGDGHAMGFRVGAELTNMEFIEATLTPRGFSVQGTNSYAGLGAHFVNRHGERYMFKYDPRGEKARRTMLIEGWLAETRAGNGPLYVDLRHLPADVLDHFERTLGIDRETLPGFFRQKGIDLRHDLIEVVVSEVSIRRGGVYFRGSGLMVDADGQTRVPHLYAAGDCSIVSGGIAGAAALGAITGRAAAARAATRRRLPEVDDAAIESARERVTAPLGRGDGLGWREFEDEVRALVTDHLGLTREADGMQRALDGLLALGRREPELAASNWHHLMRVHESMSIRLCAEMLARTALERKESRSGAAHRRVDHPTTSEEWRRLIVLRRGADGRPALRFQAPDDRTAVAAPVAATA
jgi:succinate dehydrogenase/fumarate reductase flavoprotein subunit